ncbi:hypothetical protein SESBI_42453 [Sesbania bispinosa]|nr:hypothetical protein SESBI_42453 [Sesbania bispinosa]
MSKFKSTRYSPATLFQVMGWNWALEKDMFHYSLCPRDRFSVNNVNEYHREWAYRIEEANKLITEMRKCDMKIPKQHSLKVGQNDDEALELAVNKIRHENNQMQIRINRYDTVADVCNRKYGQTRTIPDEVFIANLTDQPQYWTNGDLSDAD